MPCLYCHANARRSTVAGIPSVQFCMGCHKIIAADKPEVQKLKGYWDLKVFVRMDDAWVGSIDIAIKKARTACFFMMPTGPDREAFTARRPALRDRALQRGAHHLFGRTTDRQPGWGPDRDERDERQRGGERSSRGEGRCEGHRVGPRLAERHHPGLRMSGPRPGCKTCYGPPRASTTPSANTIRAKTRLRRPIHEACTLSRLASGESGLSRHVSVARGPT